MKILLLAVLVLACTSAMTAQSTEKETTHLTATLSGINEIPLTQISNGSGAFTATLNNDSTITFNLSFSNLPTPVIGAFINIGATKTVGGIAVVICQSVGVPPAGVPACPNDGTNSGAVTGTLTAANVLGAAAVQGLAAGDFASLVRAIASGVAYVEVFTNQRIGNGEGAIRGQIRQEGNDEDDKLPGAK